MPRPRLRTVLFLSLTAAIALPLAYLGMTQVRQWQQVRRHEVDQELQFAAEALAHSVAQSVDGEVRGIEALAGEIGTNQVLEVNQLQAAIHAYLERFPGCESMHVSGLDARAIAAEPDRAIVGSVYRDRAFYRRMMSSGGTAVDNEVMLGRVLRTPSIHVGVPIYCRVGSCVGVRLGYVAASFGLSYMRELAEVVLDTFGDVHAEVLDVRGLVIVDSASRGEIMADRSAVATYRAAPSDHVELRTGTDEHGTAVRAAVVVIAVRDLDWTVAVARPTARIEEQARHALWTTVGALSGALALGLFMSVLLSWWLAGSIGRLARYTVRVATEVAVEPPSPSVLDSFEVAGLVERVSAMVARLQAQAEALRAREAEQVVLGRLRRELEIARHIQTGILPKQLSVRGFEVAAIMTPAEEVSGDYYEFIPTPTGCWLALGDACGHGLNAGLVILMLQSALGAAVLASSSDSPAALLGFANSLLFENIRNRLGSDDYATIVLMYLASDGRFVFAGAHESVVLLRRGADGCEVLETEGIWMGLCATRSDSFPEIHGRLQPGDTIVLYSDGIVERGASKRNPFGIERLCATLMHARERSAREACEEIMQTAQGWSPATKQDEDDMTVVVLRYLGH